MKSFRIALTFTILLIAAGYVAAETAPPGQESRARIIFFVH
jgi:hypothetical protein